MDIILMLLGTILLLVLLYFVTEMPSGTKGITEEYTSPSGKKRTARKSREDHIVRFILGNCIHVLCNTIRIWCCRHNCI